MDKLSKSEQDNIRKMSDARLVSCLTKCGVSVDDVEHMDRNAMISKWAELVAAKADKPAAATASIVGYDAAVERDKLQFEKFKFEQELKFRGELETAKIQQEKDRLALETAKMQQEQDKLALETAKMQQEKEKLQQKLAQERVIEEQKLEQERKMEEQKLAQEEQKLQLQKQLEEQKLELQKQQLELEKSKLQSKTYKLKQFGDAIRNSVNKMSETSPHEVLLFFQNFERVFADLNVPNEIKVALITPYLSERCKSLLNRLQGDDAQSYDYVKKYILGQTRLVASFFIAEFNNVKRASTETFKSFMSRLSLFFEILSRVSKSR